MTIRLITIDESRASALQLFMNWQNAIIFREEVLEAMDLQNQFSVEDPMHERVEGFLKKLCDECPIKRSQGYFN